MTGREAIERLRRIEAECRDTIDEYCDDAAPATVESLRAEMRACALGADALTLVMLLLALEWITVRDAEQQLLDLQIAARTFLNSR